ncbi:hypothetical protein ABEB36_000827 [Hypothenemus hampei]|uniref:BRICHOS domain-containing protein n=1 Tax=Hypothenemus hampei TaxID=57062 RepID=A0ABD1FD59_HYPHA
MELLKRFYGVFLIFLLNLDKLCNAYGEIISETNQNTIQKTMEKPRTFHDYQTKVVAYKDLTDSKCFLEILTNVESIISRKLANFGNSTERENFKLINTSNQLTKREIWRLAGTRISDFCRGFPTYLIQNSNTTSNPLSTTENELPIVRLRTKREGKYYFRGKFNGHTQSQYLNFDNGGGQHGKAETPKAVVKSLDYQPGSQRTGSGSVEGDLSGQYYSHRGHAGRFSGTFEGTYEVDETESTQGEAEFFRRPISGTTPSQSLTPNGYRPGESPSDYPGTPAGYPSQYDGAIAPGLPGGTSYGPNYGTTGGSSSSPGSISYRPGLPTSPLGPTPGHISGYPSVGTPDSTTNSGSGYPHSGTSYGTGFPSAGAAYGPGYVPGSGSGDYPGGGISYSPGYPPGSVGYPPGSVGYTPGSVSYSPGNVGYSPGIGGYPPGNIGYPPGSVGYPPGNVGYSPGSGGYPPGNIGYSPGSGGYPPGTVGYPPGSGGYPPGVGGYSGSPGGGYGSIIPPGQYVQGGPPGTFGNATGQLINGTWVPSKVEADDADSQVLTSVQQTNNETVANAQAHGKFQGGTAQSQVSGTYSGTGSFSASAGSDDGKRGALTQVSGGKDGAQSSAQGRGGVGTSKAQVTLDSQTGDTLSSAQTSGNEQGTQTQVRASEQGGLADAQANGIGPTSSQAKIGFTPHNQVQDADNQTMLFKGGGTAAAQSGTNTGMTQTQIQGKFRYGIKYQGAAQAGSGSTYIRNLTEPKGFFKPINFTVAKVNYNQSQSPQATVKEQFKTTTSKQNPQKSEIVSTTPSTNLNTTTVRDSTRDSRDVVVSPPKNTFEKATVATEYEDQEYVDEEYDDEEPVSREQPAEPIQMRGKTKNLEPPSAVISTDQIVTTEKQHVVILDSLEGLDIPIPRSKGDIPKDGMVLQPGQIIPGSPGFQIPAGFRGKVKAFVSGQNTYAIGKNARSFSPGINQPVFGVITKKISKKDADRTEYMYHPVEYGKLKSASVLPSFVSVTKSEVDVDVSKKTSNVYSAQSTSCGMFTNTCVYANGKKTCFPVRKTNPDGSPVVC